MDARKKCVLSAGNHVHKIPRFRGGGYFGFWGGGGGVPILFLWARGFFWGFVPGTSPGQTRGRPKTNRTKKSMFMRLFLAWGSGHPRVNLGHLPSFAKRRKTINVLFLLWPMVGISPTWRRRSLHARTPKVEKKLEEESDESFGEGPTIRRLFVTCGVFARYFFVAFSWFFRGFFVALFCLEKQCSGLFRYFFVAFSWPPFWANFTRTRPGTVFWNKSRSPYAFRRFRDFSDPLLETFFSLLGRRSLRSFWRLFSSSFSKVWMLCLVSLRALFLRDFCLDPQKPHQKFGNVRSILS